MQTIQAIKNALHAIFPVLGALRYGFPARNLTVIGITGTDGKSSSVVLTARMLRRSGFVVAHYSSVSYHDGKEERPNIFKMTTPGRLQMQKFLAKAVRNGCTHAVLEITSQGIAQHRHRMIGFDVVGITNITDEHLEAHGGFEKYRALKLSLAKALRRKGKRMVVMTPEVERLWSGAPFPERPWIVSLSGSGADVEGTVLKNDIKGTTLEIRQGAERAFVHSPLGGPFIPFNMLFATGIGALYGLPLASIAAALEEVRLIPGRFEVLSSEPLVIVDYGHTLAALSALLPFVRIHTKGRLVHVFGAAGGGRDRYKRPLLAKLSERFCDMSILTEENSFDEPVGEIVNDIRTGFSGQHPVRVALRREDAVRLGKEMLGGPGDALLLTAKGSESVIAGPRRSKRPYTEREYTKWLFGIS